MGALISSDTSVITTAARPNIPEDYIFHRHRRESLKSHAEVYVMYSLNSVHAKYSVTSV
jgi:hypothetical protein